MNRRSFLSVVIAVACIGCGACGSSVSNSQRPVTQPSGPPGSNTTLVRASNRFATDLWSQLRGHPGNLAISPSSISLAFAMTYGGARGTTATEMASVFHFDDAGGNVHEAYGAMIADWNDPSRTSYELRIANRLFGERTATFHEPFLALTRDSYGAALEPADFAGDPDGSRRRINAWVEEQTHDRIRDLLPEGSLDSMVRLVLTNAIYFKGRWLHEFDPGATQPAPFHRSASDPVTVPMMQASREERYASLDGLSVLELPYVGEELSMVVLLPDDPAGLDALEARMDADALERWIAAVAPAELDVSLPRFKIDPSEPIALKSMLQALGMSLPFEPTADFTAMANMRPLFIDDAYHKAFVEVNEEGTEAAAATAVVMTDESGGMGQSFVADHPFLFLIRDTRNGAILFLGRVTDPS